ncbi:MAG: SBBP repeat-containing protein, partial [candidate division WOR-3 bacterium]
QDELPGYENFYLAHCPDGILFVKSYRKVIIKDIYPGIDWIFRYDDNGNFHHEFEVKNPQLISQIKLKVKYADIELADNGKSVILSTPIGKIKDGSLIGYQGKDIVDVSYKLIDNNLVAFYISNYDKDKSLLIDPYALVWSTYYGGGNGDLGLSIMTDIYGNVFVTGLAASIDFPTYNPGGGAYYQGSNASFYDAFILKFDNNGVRLWATYYGGSDDDMAYSITTDANGNVFVTGYTRSTDFPTQDAGTYYDNTCGTDGNCNFDGTNYYYDVFVLKFNNSGALKWATYYGGSYSDYGLSITTDGQGNVFVTGYTYSTDFPTYNPGGGAYYQSSNAGSPDVFILKFNNSGVMLWVTYYGGSDYDIGWSVTTNIYGNVFVSGNTISTDLPTQDAGGGAYYDNTFNGGWDAFILKFSNTGALLWATYYGGSGGEGGLSITTDGQGNVFVTGYTYSTDFPTQDAGGYFDGTCGTDGNCNGGYWDAFILKFSNSGTLKWATYCGGSGIDYGSSITIDIYGNVFVTGLTYSTNFPTKDPGGGAYYDNTCGTDGNCNFDGTDYYNDAFVLKFTYPGDLQWATYYGGSDEEEGYSVITDINGNLFVTGLAVSTDFPTYNLGGGAYYQSSLAGVYDAFISKFIDSSSPIYENASHYYYKDKLTLNLKSVSSPITIKIYSLDGKLIYSNIFKTNNIEINLKGLKAGIYILKAYSKNNKQLTYKFVKS